MARGYMVQLGNDVLGPNDLIMGPTTGFNIGSLLGSGSWTWSGVSASTGQPVTNATGPGTYYLGTDGNVYFVPSGTYASSISSASATAAPTYSAQTFGTSGTDTLSSGADDDVAYGGTTTSPTGTGADTIRTGAGSDTIYGGDGIDRLVGGGGNDDVYGGTGNDIMYGDDEAPIAATNETLRWSLQGGDNTSLAGGFVQDTGAMRVGVNFNNDFNQTGVVSTTETQFTGTQGYSATSGVKISGDSGPTTSVTLSFDAEPGSGLSDQVSNVNFRLNDVDAAGWIDVVTVRAWDINGNEVLVTLTGTGGPSISGQTTTGVTSTSASAANGSVLVQIAGPVHSIQVIYSNSGTVGQVLFLTDINFTTIPAAEGDDTLDGGDGSDTIFGGGGDDLLYGGTGNDLLDGGVGNDRLDGGAGNDTILGGAGDDSITGGAGNDSVSGGAGNDVVDLGDGDDIFAADGSDAGNDSIEGGAGNDSIHGGAGNDIVSGGDGADLLTGGVGDDTIDGGAGSDVITIQNGHDGDIVFGSEDPGDTDIDLLRLYDVAATGGVTVIFTGDEEGTYSYVTDPANGTFAQIERLETTNLDDVVDGSNGGMLGGGGMHVSTRGGDDSVIGTIADDHIDAGSGNDSVYGESGNDTIFGGGGDDSLDGGEGDDTIEGGAGSDTIRGDYGDDDISLGTGATGDGVVDTLLILDGDGNDIIRGFDMPTANGDGTFAGIDQLNVIGMRADGDRQVTTADVVVSDDGNGNAVLTFPAGNTLTFIGITPALMNNPLVLEAMGIPATPPPLDYTVEGTSGSDVIDVNYTDDPEGDRIDAGDSQTGGDDDLILAFGGADTVYGGAGNDTVYGGDGEDSLIGESGDDTLFGDDGADFLNGVSGNDTLYGGAGNDRIESGSGNDIVYGDDGDDSLNGDLGNDTVHGGAGNDYVRGSFGNDTVYGGEGDDYVWGGYGDDLHIVEDEFGNDTYFGDSEQETFGDTLDLSAVTADLRVDLTNGDAESGSFTDGTWTATYSEIEHLILGAGQDTLVLADFGGQDRVTGFSVPTSNGDGTFTAIDRLDTTGLTRDFGTTPVTVNDVVVTADADGWAVLTFPGGESLTLVGVLPSQIDDPFALNAIGIPFSDGTVSGTEGVDFIVAGYGGDADGDRVDDDDAILPGYTGNDDLIEAGGGADYVEAGAGNDEVYGGTGEDTIFGGSGNDTLHGSADNDRLSGDAGNDTVFGGAGQDRILASAGNDTLYGGTGNDTFEVDANSGEDVIVGGENAGDRDELSFQSSGSGITVTFADSESGTYVTDGGGASGTFSQIEAVVGSDNGDTFDASGSTGGGVYVDAAGGNDTIVGSDGDDTLYGGSGNDTMTGGLGSDTFYGGDGTDRIDVSAGDTVFAGAGDDDIYFADLGATGPGNLVVVGGEGGETGRGDILHLGTFADLSTLQYTNDDPGVGGGRSGSVTLDDGSILFFSEIEDIVCFTPGTTIATPNGARAIETLRPGDFVLTRDHGLQPIRWIGQRTVPAIGALAPIRLRPGVVPGLERDLVVSPQHRMLFQGYRAELLFGQSEVLAAAKHLVDGSAVMREEGGLVTYIHMMFDEHEVVFAEGAATESFHPGGVALDAVGEASREELFGLFPELRALPTSYGSTARRCLKRHEAILIRA